MSDTLVFIPAWNEEQNLPAVLDELRGELPDVDVLVVDDGSTDQTAAVAREHGAEVLSFGENRGLQAGIAAGYGWALEHGYAYCGRVDADGQHPAAELRRLLELVRSGRDRRRRRLALRQRPGLRAVPLRAGGDPQARHRPAAPLDARRARPALQRRDERPVRRLRQGAAACSPSRTRAARRRSRRCSGCTSAGLRVAEVPVDMRERAGGESKLQGKKAVLLVLTVIATLLGAKRLRGRRG